MGLWWCCKSKPVEESRLIYPAVYHDIETINEFVVQQNFNKIKTTKYNLLTFLPLNLFEQFKRFANIYFVFVVGLNFLPQINAFGKELAALPILFVLLLTATKDAFEDIRRWQADRKVNGTPCVIYNNISCEYEPSSWQELCAGDLVRITANETIPADIVLFRSSEPSGNCYIETANLDGEINLKQREVITIPNNTADVISPSCFTHTYFEVESPNREIYKFNGKCTFETNQGPVTLKKSNLLLRGCILRNTEFVEGIVVYAGNETKTLLNNNKLTFKRSKLEEQINRDVIWCVGLLTIICLVCTIGQTLWIGKFDNINSVVFFSFADSSISNPALQGFFVFWTSLISFQALIPLPLYVTIELVKLHHAFHITRDLELYDEEVDKRVEVRASNITEDMGQIQYIFCDKTGTLTENSMEFKRATIGHIDYYDDMTVSPLNTESQPLSNIRRILKKLPDIDMSNRNSSVEEFLFVMAVCNTTMVSENKNQSKIVIGLPNKENSFLPMGKSDSKSIENLANGNKLGMFGIVEIELPALPPQISLEEAFIIPKNLKIPEPEKVSDNKSVLSAGSRINKTSSVSKLNWFNSNKGECPYKDENLLKFYESESPDETALVKRACLLGVKLLQRGPGFVYIWKDFRMRAFELEVLFILPFDSIRKRMSTIILDPETGIITLYSKGADIAILSSLSQENNSDFIQRVCENVEIYSKIGLRTLLLAKKTLSEKYYLQWSERVKEKEQSFSCNENDLITLYNEMERDLILLGATGIEDKLQDQVPECIETFRRSGMKVWILTGDKLETAINIAYSAKLFIENQEIFVLNSTDEESILNQISSFNRQIAKNRILDSTSTLSGDPLDQFGLVLEGETLKLILDDNMINNEFLRLAVCCNSVVCCRSTPIQKAQIVSMVKNKLNVRTLAVGDGANDVNMIQTAHVGVGIGGKEGMQAVMASDFAITKFKYLRRLVIVHGHRCYDQLARMSLYMFYKDTIMVLVTFWFQIFNGFSGNLQIDQMSQTLFNLTMTGLPPLILGIWDKDFEAKILERNPQIYKSGINHMSYRPRDFWRNILDSIWQSLVIFWIIYFCYKDTEIDLGECGIVTTTALLITIFANLIIESRFLSPFHWFACIGSLLVAWFAEIFIYNSICVVLIDCKTDNPYKVVHYTMSKPKTYVVLFVITATALLPRITIKSILLSMKTSIVYEAQRRLNTYPRNERSDVYLGDLENINRTTKKSENKFADFNVKKTKSSNGKTESMILKFSNSNRITPFEEMKSEKGGTISY